jgi:hypothetical protein
VIGQDGRVRIAAIALLFAACARPPQHEITEPGELLTEDGVLREPGWSERQLLSWDPSRVRDPALLRQWDFFTIQNDEVAVNLTIVDLGFLRLCSVNAVDLATSEAAAASVFLGDADTFILSDAVEGVAIAMPEGSTTPAMRFETSADTTLVTVDIPATSLTAAAQGTFTIRRRPGMPYLSLATPFVEDPHYFFFEQKIPGMSAEGTLTIGEESWTFDAASTQAVMDWGRGGWPPAVTWRWAAASGTAGGETIAINLGDGFGDATHGTENLVVFGDVAHKLDEVEWTHDPEDPLQPWTLRSRDGRLSLTLTPTAQEVANLDLGRRYQHLLKGYGTFSGTIELDDGRTIVVEDLPGFAEEMSLSW